MRRCLLEHNGWPRSKPLTWRIRQGGQWKSECHRWRAEEKKSCTGQRRRLQWGPPCYGRRNKRGNCRKTSKTGHEPELPGLHPTPRGNSTMYRQAHTGFFLKYRHPDPNRTSRDSGFSGIIIRHLCQKLPPAISISTGGSHRRVPAIYFIYVFLISRLTFTWH